MLSPQGAEVTSDARVQHWDRQGPEAAGNEWTLCLGSPAFKAYSSYISNTLALPAQRGAYLGSSLACALASCVTVSAWLDLTEFCLPHAGDNDSPCLPFS